MKTKETIEENIRWLKKDYFARWEKLHFRDYELLHQIDLLEWVLND